MSNKYSDAILPAPASMTFDPAKSVVRTDYSDQFVRVVIVPPEEYRITGYVQNFEFGVTGGGVSYVGRDAAPGFASVSDWPRFPVVAVKVGNAPVDGLPVTFQLPRMLFYEQFDFVLSLYQRTAPGSNEYALAWSEIAPCVLDSRIFKQPRLGAHWVRDDSDPTIPDLVRCTRTVAEIMDEKWAADKLHHDVVTWPANKSLLLRLCVARVTQVDARGASTGEPLTFYQDRVYALQTLVLAMDEDHVRAIVDYANKQ